MGGKEEIPLDIRIIVSTNHNIKQDVESRQFSSELFYRLNIFYLKIPPLRERRGDIAYCADYFVKRLNALYPNSPHLCSQEFLDGLERYEWPGNTRELQNSLERAFISSPEMTLSAESLRVAFAAGIESPVEQELRQGGKRSGGDPHGADSQRRRCGRSGQKIEDEPRDPVSTLEKVQYFA